jgi:hypothetical protein
MRIGRSIGEAELRMLLSGSVVNGKYNCSTESQNSNKDKNVVCFFVDDVKWQDKAHKFFIICDIPASRLKFGVGEYWAAKTMAKTNIWTGRRGDTLYGIREAYIQSYSIADVKAIYLYNYFADWYIEKIVTPACAENNIELHVKDYDVPPLNGEVTQFVQNKEKDENGMILTKYVTKEFIENNGKPKFSKEEEKQIEKEKYILETIQMVSKQLDVLDDDAFSLAKKIRKMM